jgi:hypothetical protein
MKYSTPRIERTRVVGEMIVVYSCPPEKVCQAPD